MTLPPAPRRIGRPKWLSVRVIVGVLILVAAIAIGSRVVGAASRTAPVWALTHDLAPGTVIAQSDLVAVEVNLGANAAAYVATAASVHGQVLNRQVVAGELLPATAVQQVGDARVLNVAVAAEHLAPGLGHGSVADIYLITGRAAVIGEAISTRLIKQGVTIQSVTAPASGGLSGASSSRYQVALLLPPVDADVLVRRLPLGDPVIVAWTSDRPNDVQGG